MRHSFTRSGRPLLFIPPAGFLGICHRRQGKKQEEDMDMNNFFSLLSLSDCSVAPLFELGASIIGGWLADDEEWLWFEAPSQFTHATNVLFPLPYTHTHTHTCVCVSLFFPSSDAVGPGEILIFRAFRSNGHHLRAPSAPVLHNGRAFVYSTRFVFVFVEVKDIRRLVP